MKTKLGIAFVAAALTACSPATAPAADQTAAAPALETETPMVNMLTAAEQAEGWKLLFNGTDLAGWRGYKKDAPGAALGCGERGFPAAAGRSPKWGISSIRFSPGTVFFAHRNDPKLEKLEAAQLSGPPWHRR